MCLSLRTPTCSLGPHSVANRVQSLGLPNCVCSTEILRQELGLTGFTCVPGRVPDRLRVSVTLSNNGRWAEGGGVSEHPASLAGLCRLGPVSPLMASLWGFGEAELEGWSRGQSPRGRGGVLRASSGTRPPHSRRVRDPLVPGCTPGAGAEEREMLFFSHLQGHCLSPHALYLAQRWGDAETQPALLHHSSPQGCNCLESWGHPCLTCTEVAYAGSQQRQAFMVSFPSSQQLWEKVPSYRWGN